MRSTTLPELVDVAVCASVMAGASVVAGGLVGVVSTAAGSSPPPQPASSAHATTAAKATRLTPCIVCVAAVGGFRTSNSMKGPVRL